MKSGLRVSAYPNISVVANIHARRVISSEDKTISCTWAVVKNPTAKNLRRFLKWECTLVTIGRIELNMVDIAGFDNHSAVIGNHTGVATPDVQSSRGIHCANTNRSGEISGC